MVRYLFEGGIWFMGTLSVLFLGILILSLMAGKLAIAGRVRKTEQLSGYIKSLALFTLVFGIFGQILGLADIFDYLATQNSEIAPAILSKGIQITCYTTIYGIIIYLISILISLGLKFRVNSVK